MLVFFMALHKFSYDCCFIAGCGFRMSAATTTLLCFLWLSTMATGVEFIANKCLWLAASPRPTSPSLAATHYYGPNVNVLLSICKVRWWWPKHSLISWLEESLLVVGKRLVTFQTLARSCGISFPGCWCLGFVLLWYEQGFVGTGRVGFWWCFFINKKNVIVGNKRFSGTDIEVVLEMFV